jgi:hypothetical protein
VIPLNTDADIVDFFNVIEIYKFEVVHLYVEHMVYHVMYKFNCTRQLHESIVVMWLCKCECRTHRESCLSKINFKVPKLILS